MYKVTFRRVPATVVEKVKVKVTHCTGTEALYRPYGP